MVGRDSAGNWQPETNPTIAAWEVNIVIPGDVNDDEGRNVSDAILALQSTIGIATNPAYAAADLNGDVKIGVAEAIFVLQEVSDLRQ